jgi:hypothetical protein
MVEAIAEMGFIAPTEIIAPWYQPPVGGLRKVMQ